MIQKVQTVLNSNKKNSKFDKTQFETHSQTASKFDPTFKLKFSTRKIIKSNRWRFLG